MKTTHTSGPWSYSPAIACVYAQPPDAPQICMLPAFRPDNAANGALIAAAPELLAALEALAECFDGDIEAAKANGDEEAETIAIERLRIARIGICRALGYDTSAIAKAKGTA